MGSFAEALTYLPLAIIGLAAAAGARHLFLYSSSPALKIFSKVWIALFFFEVAGNILTLFSTNQWFYNILQAGWVLSLSFIYLHVLGNNRLRAFIQVFMALFAVFYIMNSLFIQGFDDLQTITYVAGGLFIILLAGAYFWQLLVSPDNEKITRDPFFWLSFGLVVYFGGTIPFFGMWNYLVANFLEFTDFYFSYIYKSFSLFLNILVTIAFLCRKNYPK